MIIIIIQLLNHRHQQQRVQHQCRYKMVVDNQMEHRMDRLIQLEDKKLKDKLISFLCVLLFFFLWLHFFARVTFFFLFFLQSTVSLSLSLLYFLYTYIFCSLWKEKTMYSRLDLWYDRLSSPWVRFHFSAS
jgi:hypothetical protein